MRIFKNDLIKNTMILVISSLIVKALALVYRILLTRILENNGITLYVLCIPTIMLFISLGCFSINITLAKLISENEITNKYSNKVILKKAIIVSLITSFITIIILLIIIYPLTYSWLKQPNTFYPILMTIFLIPLSAVNNVVKGYYNGINKVNISAYSGLIEQISRIIVSIVFLYILLPYGIVISVTFSVISMGVGELISLIYGLILLKKHPVLDNGSTANPTKEIVMFSLPTLGSKIIGNVTYFLEPIVYTFALGLIAIDNEKIAYHYSEVNAYAIPLVTMFSFLSLAIATVIIPNISKFNSLNNQEMVRYYAKKSIIASFVPGILITIILTFYGKEYMNLLYNSDVGSTYVESYSVLFILFYIQAPLVAILQAIGKTNFSFKVSLFANITKIVLIVGLTFIPRIGNDSLIISLLLTMTISTLYYYFYLKNHLNFHFSKSNYINIIIISLITYLSLYLLETVIQINFLLSSIIITVIFLIFATILKITRVDDK